MTIRVYYSTDASAPVLSSTAGALIGVLDACLVTGYGSRTAAGWAKAFSGTNKAAYRAPAIAASPSEGNRYYLRIDNAGSFTAYGARGYETMSDVDTGTNPFPTVAQVAGAGVFFTVSNTANSTARPWIVIASESFFYLISQLAGVTLGDLNNGDGLFAFGDFKSYLGGDIYNTLIHGREGGDASTQDGISRLNISGTYAGNTYFYLARPYTGVAGAVNVAKSVCRPGEIRSGESFLHHTDEVTRSWFLTAMQIREPISGQAGQSTLRGTMPGLYVLLNRQTTFPFATGTIVTPTSGPLAGRNLLAFRANSTGGVFIDTSDTW